MGEHKHVHTIHQHGGTFTPSQNTPTEGTQTHVHRLINLLTFKAVSTDDSGSNGRWVHAAQPMRGTQHRDACLREPLVVQACRGCCLNLHTARFHNHLLLTLCWLCCSTKNDARGKTKQKTLYELYMPEHLLNHNGLCINIYTNNEMK